MVNPVLTIAFNLFLVGTALTVIAAMVQEYLASRTPSVGGGRRYGMDRPERQPRRVSVPASRRVKRAA